MAPSRLKNPKTIARKLTELALERLELSDRIDRIKAQEQELLALGAERFKATGETQVEVPGVGKVTRDTAPVATVEDWGAVFAYHAKHPEAGVVHKRVSPTAIEKLSFDGKTVPGVVLSHHEVLKVNVRVARAAAKKGGRR